MKETRSLADIVSEGICRLQSAGLAIVESPRVGIFKVFDAGGTLIDHTYKAIIDNVIERGGNNVRIRWAFGVVGTNKLRLTLDVIDDGPTPTNKLFEDENIGFGYLRRRANHLGGHIGIWRTTEGHMLRLELPL